MEGITRTNLSSKRIRKITVGELHDKNFTVTIGQSIPIGNGERLSVSKIVRDENAYFLFGAVVYLVYGKKKGEEEVLWRYFEHHKIMVELEL